MDLQSHPTKWKAQHIGEGIYLIYPKPNENEVTMTGVDIDEKFYVPFPHQILDLDLYHSDASHDDSVDSLKVELKRDKGSMKQARRRDMFWKRPDITVASYGVQFPPNAVFDACTWTMTLNSTSTDIVYPLLKVRKLSQKEVL